MTNPWDAKTDLESAIERVARAIIIAERKSTHPDDTMAFFDPFRWDGELTTEPGAYATEQIQNVRPAWTAPRIIRMANAALQAVGG